jgi:group I intron endonuclease
MIIYMTKNLINGKSYVGQQSTNDEIYLGSGKILKRAIVKYGVENFKKEIIEECLTREELNKREIYWIKKLKPDYNIHEGGYGGYNEFAVRVNKKRKGKTWEEIYSPDGLEKMRSIERKGKNNGFYGKTHTEETKKLNAEQARKMHTGSKRSEESKLRISIALKNSKKHKEAMGSKEVREKISKSVSKVLVEQWKDPHYRENIMKGRKKYYKENPKVKKEDLERLLTTDKSVTEIIYELGVSIPTYYKYKKQYGF